MHLNCVAIDCINVGRLERAKSNLMHCKWAVA